MKKAGILLLSMLMPMASAYAESTKPLSVDVLWQLNRIGSPIISPDGDKVVAPVTQYDVPEDKGSTQLWLFDKDGDSQQALTAKGMRASEATFSPDEIGRASCRERV